MWSNVFNIYSWTSKFPPLLKKFFPIPRLFRYYPKILLIFKLFLFQTQILGILRFCLCTWYGVGFQLCFFPDWQLIMPVSAITVPYFLLTEFPPCHTDSQAFLDNSLHLGQFSWTFQISLGSIIQSKEVSEQLRVQKCSGEFFVISFSLINEDSNAIPSELANDDISAVT